MRVTNLVLTLIQRRDNVVPPCHDGHESDIVTYLWFSLCPHVGHFLLADSSQCIVFITKLVRAHV